MIAKYEIIGTTDEVTECYCCGKQNLKSTVVLKDNDTDDYVFFGCVCAAKVSGQESLEAKEIRKMAKDAQKEAVAAARKELYNHPITKQINKEIEAVSGKDLGAERMKLVHKWQEMENKAREEISAKYPSVKYF